MKQHQITHALNQITEDAVPGTGVGVGAGLAAAVVVTSSALSLVVSWFRALVFCSVCAVSVAICASSASSRARISVTAVVLGVVGAARGWVPVAICGSK